MRQCICNGTGGTHNNACISHQIMPCGITPGTRVICQPGDMRAIVYSTGGTTEHTLTVSLRTSGARVTIPCHRARLATDDD